MSDHPTVPNTPAQQRPNPAMQLERRGQELALLAEVTHIVASTEAPEAVLSLVVDRTRVLLGCEAVALVGVVPDRSDLVLLAALAPALDPDAPPAEPVPRAGTLLDRALAENSPLELDAGSPAALDPLVLLLLGGDRADNGIVVPLRAAGAERGGLLAVNAPTGFTAEDHRLLVALGDLAAIAIDRAQLRRTRSDDATRLEVLNAVLQVTSAGFEEEALIRRAVEALLARSPVERAVLRTEQDGEHRLRYAFPRPPEAETAYETEPRSWRLHRRVAAESRPAVVRETPAAAEEEPFAICVPLRARDRTLGTLYVARRSAPYDEQEVELFTAVGEHLGIAIELSRLFRLVATEAEHLERVSAEQAMALKEAQDQLTRAQWLASLGELAAGVAHDLNNALNPIVAFAELIEEHVDQPDKVRAYAERILMAAQGGAETVRRIQRFTRRRLGSLPFESVALDALAREALELMRPKLASRPKDRPIHIVEALNPDLYLHGNPGELRQALLNVLGNAIDAMPAGGTLRLVGRREGAHIGLAVQDTGTGMSPEVYKRALEPFFTTKGAQGTGLGLAEVYGIVRRHDGEMELESWPAVGTTVLLRFPAMEGMPAPPKPRRRLSGVATRAFRILLVDDNLLSLEATAASLRAAGHTVATAGNAQAALKLFHAGAFDIVLTDIGLPDMTGWELVDRMRRRDAKVRVGVITGWTLPEGNEDLQRRGIELAFVKPVDPDELLAAL